MEESTPLIFGEKKETKMHDPRGLENGGIDNTTHLDHLDSRCLQTVSVGSNSSALSIPISSSLSSSHSSVKSVSSKKKIRRKIRKKPVQEELQHVSDMSLSVESSTRSSPRCSDPERGLPDDDEESRRSSASSIKVEVPDIWGDESINFTTSTLRVCKDKVLRPYWGLLTFIGWRGVMKDSVRGHLLRWKIFNFLYTTTILLLLLYTYMYEIMACEWKLTVDTANPTETPILHPTTVHVQPTNSSYQNTTKYFTSKNGVIWIKVKQMPFAGGSTHINVTALGEDDSQDHIQEGCSHIVTTYLIPNVLHLLAYLLGLFYFRMQENEQLYALMEKVFLQAAPIQARTASQHKMIIRLRVLLAVGSIWVMFTVLVQCLYVWAFDFPQMPLYTKIGFFHHPIPDLYPYYRKRGYYAMLAVALVGRTVFNSVILAIVMNYVTQCEMIKFYVQGLTTRLQEKSTDLKAAMKDMLMIRHSVGMLNGVISRMTSLVTFIVGELTIIGLCIIVMNDINEFKVWMYRGLFPFMWACVLVIPLWQAGRVNSMMLRIQKISLEMRVFGYKGASILDLDSFLQFVTLIRPKTKLFHIPITPSYLIFTLVMAAFILLILIQTGSIGLMDLVF